MRKIINKLKLILEWRGKIVNNLLNNSNEYLVKYDKYIYNFSYLFLGIVLINFIINMWYNWDILKIIIFLFWIYVTYFILITMRELVWDINLTKERKFIIYALIFFWLNISCAFFFIWSGIMRPFLRFTLLYWEINKYLPWEIKIEKIIYYSFFIEYWQIIFLLIAIFFKILYDAVYFDEEMNEVNYHLYYKETFLYKYKKYIEIFYVIRWPIWCISTWFKLLFINNNFYINDILSIISIILLIINLILVILIRLNENRKK